MVSRRPRFLWRIPRLMTPNRWRIPIGAVAVHICIGSVYAWSTFNRPIQALFPGQPWWFSPPVHDVHDRARAARAERRVRRTVGRAARPARGGDRGGAVLRRRPAHRRRSVWRLRQPVLVFLGHGRHRRHRLRPRLHLAGQHAGEMVSRSPRHGDRAWRSWDSAAAPFSPAT